MDHTFQCITWMGDDSYDENGIPDTYNIKIFGRNAEGKSICCETTFQPYFFIELPQNFKQSQVKTLIDTIKSKLWVMKQSNDENDGEDDDNNRFVLLKDHLDMKKSIVVKKKKFYGFTNDKQFTFLRLVFNTKSAFNRALSLLKNKGDTEEQRRKMIEVETLVNGKTVQFNFNKRIYEANIDPLIRFMHIREIKSAGWVECKNCLKIKQAKQSICDIEIRCEWQNMNGVMNDKIAPIVIASYDIETYSPDGSFPDATKKECPIIQIAITFQKCGENEPYKKHLINLGTCDDIKDCDIETCKSEKNVIMKFVDVLKKENVDIITGYNIWKFDFDYIHKRAKLLDINDKLVIGKLQDHESTIYKASFSSSAYGDNDYNMLKTPGMLQIDLYELIKRDYKLPKYSLDAVSEHFLQEHKLDMPYKLMFEKYKGTSKDRKEIGEYCVQDTMLPLKIISKLNIVPNLMEMAKATHVPISYLLERGQQIKVFSQILYETRKENMLVRTIYERPKNDTFVGATVLNAKKGAYMDKIVTGLDFASLYPTIMRAHNLCYNTIVLDAEYKNLKNIEYETINLDVDGITKECIFVQNRKGVLPKLLENLAKNRKEAKKQMAKSHDLGDKFMESVYNGKQLAFKVSMNSIYGFCAAQMLPCQDISASVTTIGRQMIDKTKQLVEEWYPGSEVIYGDTDSVLTIFDVGDLKGKKAMQKTFEIGKEAADKISKTFRFPIELEFEKCYNPYLLFSKKRYAGLMYTKPDKPDYIDAKGIQLVRRDNCALVKQVSQKVLDKIMYDKNIDAAIKIVQDTARRLLKHKIDIDDLIVSKSLRKNYASQKKYDRNGLAQTPKDPNLPHFTVAEKIESRNPGTKPKCGERVPYVFIETKNKNDLQYQKAEDPTYVKENKLKLDVMYYLEHALCNPMKSLFELYMDDPYKTLFNDVLLENQGQTQISSFFKAVK